MTAQEDKVATAYSITSKLVLNLYGNEEVSDLTVFMPIAQKNEYHTVWRIRVSDGFIYEGQRGLQKKRILMVIIFVFTMATVSLVPKIYS